MHPLLLLSAIWVLAGSVHFFKAPQHCFRASCIQCQLPSSCQVWPGIHSTVGNRNWTSDLSQAIFLGQLVALCVFTIVYVSSVCILHKGILSPPSWSYQSLAELRGVGKVIHTTGGSIHTADYPQCCLLCLFDSSQAPKDEAHPFTSVLDFSVRFLFVSSQVKSLSWGQRSVSQFHSCNDISSSLFQSLSTK